MTAILDLFDTKRCPLCEKLLPKDLFIRVRARCRECVAKYRKAWRSVNPEAIRASHAAWRAANPERSRAHSKTYYDRHPARRRSKTAAWRAANPERSRLIERAGHLARQAVKRGEIRPRPDACECCGRTDQKIEMSHNHYSRPLEIEWLAVSCHRRKDHVNPLSLSALVEEQAA